MITLPLQGTQVKPVFAQGAFQIFGRSAWFTSGWVIYLLSLSSFQFQEPTLWKFTKSYIYAV